MGFILSESREVDVLQAFQKYREYLLEHQDVFPVSAYQLASSEWYFDPTDHRCPHDAWLEKCIIAEQSHGERQAQRGVSIHLKLLGAYHDGYMTLTYPHVYQYTLQAYETASGHHDWRYDEFRLSDAHHVIHEIEWCGLHNTAHWVIEADDVLYQWNSVSEPGKVLG